MKPRKYFLAVLLLAKFSILQVSADTIESIRRKVEGRMHHARIPGGYKCTTKEYPFMVPISVRVSFFGKLTDPMYYCGGTLISPEWVLTAAHCIHRVETNVLTVIYALDSVNKTVGVLKVFSHPDYVAPKPAINWDEDEKPQKIEHDIGLLQLDATLSKENDVEFVKLPMEKTNTDPPCTNGLVIGWGRMTDNTLPSLDNMQCATVPLIPFYKCKEIHKEHGRIVHTPNGFCTFSTEGINVCDGDSGGPLLCDGVQYGTVSWGKGSGKKCDKDFPVVFTKIDDYMDWIRTTLSKHSIDSRSGLGMFDDAKQNHVPSYFMIFFCLFSAWYFHRN